MEFNFEEKALLKGLVAEEINSLNHKEFKYDEMLTLEKDEQRRQIIHDILVSIDHNRKTASRLLAKLESN